MPFPNEITASQPCRLVGTPRCPDLTGICADAGFDDDARFIPTSHRRPSTWVAALALSRIHRDDLLQLRACMGHCGSFYRWACDTNEETHNRPGMTGR